ncbi:hypothetical protein [Alcanivorax sp. NBRC 102028]|uniref:hypothetical protein n=1 Tax=Alcanivorax sp. NBRC 102028 TaxID=1113897 RepID=UPI000B220566|nr:hypothetical protein [Alcanivorax sp. NBRC 102028]
MSQAKFKRFNFSLTDPVSKDIDEISLLPRDFKCSRSDVLKAAILSFKELSKAEQIENLRKVCVDRENA